MKRKWRTIFKLVECFYALALFWQCSGSFRLHQQILSQNNLIPLLVEQVRSKGFVLNHQQDQFWGRRFH